jgi:iron complex outermembrane receptor protein
MRNACRNIAARLLIALALLPVCPAQGQAQSRPPALAGATLEELLNVQITSANRKRERANDVPAAVYVLTQGDIRRSGIRTLPELFRLVPGMQVSRINSTNWAISVRGFADLFSDKLLVLIDGRSIYNRQFSGVFWDTEDLLVDDIDRIEVIRGSGGAVWGANAVNGVINIVTKSAQETKGALVRVAGGTFDRTQASVRYGGSLGDASYRVFSQWSDHGRSQLDRKISADDPWHSLTNGVRIDWTRRSNAFMVEGSFITSESRPGWIIFSGPTPGITPTTDGIADRNSGSMLGRWTHTDTNGGSLQVQSFWARRHLDDVSVKEIENIRDIDVQYRSPIGDRQDVVVGGGYRNAVDRNAEPQFAYSITPETTTAVVLNAFAQDEIDLRNRLKLTLGAKLERDGLVGWNLQPTGRLMWAMTPSQRTWAAVSRAVRTPSSSDLSIRVNYAVLASATGLPIVLGFTGNPAYRPEQVLDTEAGYRIELGSNVAFDVSAFHGSYDHLKTSEPMAPVVEATPSPVHLFIGTQYGNLLAAETSGVEVAAHWSPTIVWRLDGSYSGFHLAPHLDPASGDAAAAQYDGNAPAHQWQLHASLPLGAGNTFNVGLYHVGQLRQIGAPAYTRADANIRVRLSKQLSLIATGQDLFNPGRFEFPSLSTRLQDTSVPRSGTVHLVWRY